MKKVLLITYAWPPAGGPGVQRVLKFAKFLPKFGWEPLVLTVKGGTFAAIDETLLQEVPPSCRVYPAGAFEPSALYKRFIGMKADERIPVAVLAEPNPGIKKRIANWVRLNLFVPDAKIGWWPGAVKLGLQVITEQRPDLIFSSAPPPTTHLVAATLARRSGLPWVADFRDPWTDTHYYEGHTRVGLTERVDRTLERSVCVATDRVVFVSKLDLDAYAERYSIADKCVHIPNGYDELDFAELPEVSPPRDRFTLVHLGSIGIERNPANLFRVTKELMEQGSIDPERFRIQLIGSVQESVLATIRDVGAEGFVERVPYVPHHEALQYAARAHALLLLITQSHLNLRILPGKTFEYIRYGKPIVTLGPPGGEVDRILREIGAGLVLPYDDTVALKNTLLALYSDWTRGESRVASQTSAIARYTRENLTRELAAVFDGATSE